MEKIEFVLDSDLEIVNKLLEEGWTVKDIKTFNQVVSVGGQSGTNKTGSVGAYIILEKQE